MNFEFAGPPPFASEDIPGQVIRRLLTGEEVANVTYLGLSLPNLPANQPVWYSTYSPAWAEHYVSHGYFKVDPAVVIGATGVVPFDWQEHTRGDNTKRLFNEAREFGLAEQGLSIPLTTVHGDRALFSINSRLQGKDWTQFKKAVIGPLSLFAYQFHLRMLERLGIPYPAAVELSSRERDVLAWAAAGKTQLDTAQILGLSDSTVQFYLRSAMSKLSATNKTQAVATALRLGLIG